MKTQAKHSSQMETQAEQTLTKQIEVQMEAHLKLFWELGYVVIPDVISPKVVADVMAAVERYKYDPIFAFVFGEAFDEHHRQASFLTRQCKPLKTLQSFVRQRILLPANMKWDAQQWVVLKSLVGGEQEPHHDLPAFEVTRARASK